MNPISMAAMIALPLALLAQIAFVWRHAGAREAVRTLALDALIIAAASGIIWTRQ